MNSAAAYTRVRNTVLEMLEDRLYDFNFKEARAVTDPALFQANRLGIREGDTALNPVDLVGFDRQGLPCIVHFSRQHLGKDAGRTLLTPLVDVVLRTPQVIKWIKEHYSTTPARDEIVRTNPQGDLALALNGIHIIVVFDASDMTHNKLPRDLVLLSSQSSGPLTGRYDVEVFPLDLFRVNITRHEKQPLFKLLTEEERNAHLDHFRPNINEKDLAAIDAQRMGNDTTRYYEAMIRYFAGQFAKISHRDPVNMYYHGRTGDIYEIIRGGRDVTYRIVVGR